ncbi:MAG: hypothetical protein ACKO0Z_02690, partial [Betaproteobacteria bacterium]
MASQMLMDYAASMAYVADYPTTRGVIKTDGFTITERQSLPTDPIGTFTLTLTNVITGSAIQIESQDGSTTLHNSTAAGSTVNITLQAYAAGSNLNDLRI